MSDAATTGQYKTTDQIVEEIQREKIASYFRTKARLDEIERVVQIYEKKKEFIVIRMYYFGEDLEGNDRENKERDIWEEIALELSNMGG